MAVPLDVATIRDAPKVLLHDHLDGGLRPATVVELAEATGRPSLPTTDPDELAGWFLGAARSGSPQRHRAASGHTVAVMQTAEALHRVAAECAEDLAEDGVVYAEVRFAPERHVERGLSPDAAVQAVLDGLRTGTARAAEQGRKVRVGCLLTAVHHAARSLEIAELAVRYRDVGVAGFDIAGSEAGGAPTGHRETFDFLRRQNAYVTIDAGEALGQATIREALQWRGADRIGHGVRIVDDIAVGHDGSATLGGLAVDVRDRRIPLEMCPTSDVHTGAAPSPAEHPIGLLARLRFRVTVNTDDRLMSGVTLSQELAGLAEVFGYGWADLRWFTVNAAKSAFIAFDERSALIEDVIEPGYAALMH